MTQNYLVGFVPKQIIESKNKLGFIDLDDASQTYI